LEDDTEWHVGRDANGITDNDLELREDVVEVDGGMSEEGLANFMASQTPIREEIHSQLAVKVA
jgi:hypothetical protein